MVRRIEIENFKSIQKLEFELGRVNVIIGANGSGKSNILEAIAFASCASENKLDNDYLHWRGIRVSNKGELMKNGFNNEAGIKDIIIKLHSDKDAILDSCLNFSGKEYIEWFDKNRIEEANGITSFLQHLLDNENPSEFDPDIAKITTPLKINIQNLKQEHNIPEDDFKNIFGNYFINQIAKNFPFYKEFKDFLIYAPETSALRNFEEDGKIEPLGVKGEGLFKLLKIIAESKPEQLKVIKDNLNLLDWFDDINVSPKLLSNQRAINIKDKYIGDLFELDQKAANEGFLYLLFYFSLIVSNHTPKFFAIDNIDNSLNPKLCQALTKRINILAKEFDKQVILTTHNPSVLDGLDLNDDEQRLFVAYRNDDGHTKLRRILKPELPKGSVPVRLSEMFVRGTIGGLPNNF